MWCGALRDLVAFVQFKKREKNPQRSVNFSKVAGCQNLFFNKVTGLRPANATKPRNASHIGFST